MFSQPDIYLVTMQTPVNLFVSLMTDATEIGFLALFILQTIAVYSWTYNNLSSVKWDRSIIRGIYLLISTFVLLSTGFIGNTTLFWLSVLAQGYFLYQSPYLGRNCCVDPTEIKRAEFRLDPQVLPCPYALAPQCQPANFYDCADNGLQNWPGPYNGRGPRRFPNDLGRFPNDLGRFPNCPPTPKVTGPKKPKNNNQTWYLRALWAAVGFVWSVVIVRALRAGIEYSQQRLDDALEANQKNIKFSRPSATPVPEQCSCSACSPCVEAPLSCSPPKLVDTPLAVDWSGMIEKIGNNPHALLGLVDKVRDLYTNISLNYPEIMKLVDLVAPLGQVGIPGRDELILMCTKFAVKRMMSMMTPEQTKLAFATMEELSKPRDDTITSKLASALIREVCTEAKAAVPATSPEQVAVQAPEALKEIVESQLKAAVASEPEKEKNPFVKVETKGDVGTVHVYDSEGEESKTDSSLPTPGDN